MILKIYIITVVFGLIFPLYDSFFFRFSSEYRKIDVNQEDGEMFIYRKLPLWAKLLAIVTPIFNLIFVVNVLSMLWATIRIGIIVLKKAFIWWLAGTSIKKHLKFKIRLVKKVFPAYLEEYYRALEYRHWNYKLAKDLADILKKLAENEGTITDSYEVGIGKTKNQAFDYAQDLADKIEEDKKHGSKR